MISFTASQVLAYLYCPRFTYYGEVMGVPQNEELRFKVLQGRQIHENKVRYDRGALRKKLGVVQKELEVYLGGEGYPFRGVVDEVLTFADGTKSPLDWKFAEYKETLFKTYKTQAVIYADLIQRIYGVSVVRAFVVFVRSAYKLVEVPITEKDYESLAETHRSMEDILKGAFPKATTGKRRCEDCCYRNICPK